MRYQVPQFIETEDTIFGPLTFKQFVYVVGGAGLCFVIYKLLPLYLGVFLIIPVAGLALALAFYKINNQPFIKILEYAFYYTIGNKLYLWRKSAASEKKATAPKEAPAAPLLSVPTISESKLKNLAWSLDVHERVGNTEH